MPKGTGGPIGWEVLLSELSSKRQELPKVKLAKSPSRLKGAFEDTAVVPALLGSWGGQTTCRPRVSPGLHLLDKRGPDKEN